MEYWIWFAAAGLLGLNIIMGAGIIAADRRQRKKELPDSTDGRNEDISEDVFSRFLPEELLGMIGIDDVSVPPADILAGQEEVQAVILHGNIAEFQELIHVMGTKEVYALINRVLSHTVPAVYGNGGMVDSYQDAGIRALFTGQMESGLNAAVLICERMLQVEDDRGGRDFSVGLCFGKVSIGVVGYGRKLSVLTLSTYTGFGEFLQRMGPKYYAKILAAGSYVDHIRGFEKNYNYRLLGIFFVRDTGSEEKIYDIFDGDEAGTRNRKRKTKMLFEKGVALFLGREFEEARIYFIEVLKADHSDRAAREYVYLCDTYGGMEGDEEPAQMYLEYF